MFEKFKPGKIIGNFYRRIGSTAEHSLENSDKRGFIVLQIDGLSRFILNLAVRKRTMPFLARMVRRKKLNLMPLFPGLPATTPAFQLAVMYGEENRVPGFRWFEKDKQQFRIMKGIEDTAAIEEEVEKANGPGVLHGGVSYCTLFSGSAAESTFTASRLSLSRERMAFSVFETIILFLLHFGAFLRVIGLSFLEMLTEIYDEIKVRMAGRMRRSSLAFTLVRIISNVVLRETATGMAVVDIYRGVPSIYINYFGYDELGHHRGPVSIMARLSLRGIDAQIRKIWKAAQKAWPGRYDLYVISDHGQVPTVPFEKLYGMEFSDYLSNVLLKQKVNTLRITGDELRISRTLSFINYLNSLAPMLPKWLKKIADHSVSKMSKELSDVIPESNAGELGDVYVLPTSDMAHVYFNRKRVRLSVEELEIDHPGAIAAIVGHPGVFMAAGRSPRGTKVFTKRGMSLLNPVNGAVIEGIDPFKLFDAVEGLRASLVHLVKLEHSGDLVVFLAKKGIRVLNFQEELGGHGGLYAEEQSAFVVGPPSVIPSPRGDAAQFVPMDLHKIFSSYGQRTKPS